MVSVKYVNPLPLSKISVKKIKESRYFGFDDTFFEYSFIGDVSPEATCTISFAPKFSDALTLFQPGGADSTHHSRGYTIYFPAVLYV